MHDRDILAPDIIDHNLPNLGICPPIPQEKQITPLERRLHRPGQHHDNRRRGIGEDAEALPQHKGRGEDEREVKDLRCELPRFEGGEGGEHLCCGERGRGQGLPMLLRIYRGDNLRGKRRGGRWNWKLASWALWNEGQRV